MRLFTAIPVSWRNIKSAHITLNFFGDISEEQAEIVKMVFEKIGSQFRAFNVTVDKIKQFRDQAHAVVEKNESLINLQHQLETEFRKAGFTFQDRTYYPHIKLKNLHGEKFENQNLKPLIIKVERVVLYQSILRSTHAEHIPLTEIILKP